MVPFQRVWERSYCQPVERLVDIVSEYPSEMEHLFSPSCVSLLRCTGCCSDEKMHCMPLETANITLQVGRRPGSGPSLPRHPQPQSLPPERGDQERAGQGHRTQSDTQVFLPTALLLLEPQPHL